MNKFLSLSLLCTGFFTFAGAPACVAQTYYPSIYYPSSCHWIVALSGLGESMEIEDGSVWKINGSDTYKVLHWASSDPLLLTENTEWFSSYTYRFVNKNTGYSAAVNLFRGPIVGTEYHRRISALDITNGDLILSDNSYWKIAPHDLSTFRNWSFDQTIIIGCSSGWNGNYDSILINVEHNKFVRAYQH